MAPRMSELSAFLSERLTMRLEPYGMRIVDFSISSISTPEDDPAVKRLKEALAKRAEMNILGYNYQQERSFDVMQAVAGNEGSGMAPVMGAGIGLGMGFGFGTPMGAAASQMAQNIQGGIPQPPSPPCPKCGAPTSQGMAFCPSCGERLATPPPTPMFCVKCGAQMAPGNRFCAACGTPVA